MWILVAGIMISSAIVALISGDFFTQIAYHNSGYYRNFFAEIAWCGAKFYT